MKTKKLSKLFLVISIMVITIFSSTVANAAPLYVTWSDHKNINGVANHYYWYDSSATLYSAILDNAIDSWNHTYVRTGVQTRIYYTYTTAKYNALMELWSDYNVPPSGTSILIAQTVLWNGGTAYPTNTAPTGDWTWAAIHTNQYSSAFPSLDTTTKQGTLAHEMGHAFGLAHVTANGTQVIMLQLGQGRTVYQPVADDCYGINHLYP